jgi:hypothetical protein
MHSMTRYYLNNFHDGQMQDAYDLLLGEVLDDVMACHVVTIVVCHVVQTGHEAAVAVHVRSGASLSDDGMIRLK